MQGEVVDELQPAPENDAGAVINRHAGALKHPFKVVGGVVREVLPTGGGDTGYDEEVRTQCIAQGLFGVFVMLAQGFEDRFGFASSDGGSQGVLAGEVVVKQGTSDAGIASDSAHGGTQHAAASEMFCSNFQNLLFAFVRFHAQGTGARLRILL